MAIYLVLIPLVIFTAIANKKFLTFSTLLILFLISAFRWNVGYDFAEYASSYDSALSGNLDLIRFNFLYKAIYWFSALIKFDRGFFFITSIIFTLMTVLIAMRHKFDLSILIFFIFFTAIYFNSFNQIRQVLGIMIFLFGTSYLIEKKILKYIITVLVASIFHLSLIYLVILPIFIYKLTKINIYWLIFFTVLSFLITDQVISVLYLITKNIPFLTQYTYHFDSTFMQMDFANYFVKILKNIGVILFIIYIYRKSDDKLKLYFIIFWLGIIAGNMLPGLLSRISLPLVYFEIIFFTYFLTKSRKNFADMSFIYNMALLIMISYTMSKFFVYFYRNIGGFIPYAINYIGVLK